MPIPNAIISVTDIFGERWSFYAEGLVIFASSNLTPTPWVTFTLLALPFSLRIDHDGSLYLGSGKASLRHHYRNYADGAADQWQEI